MKLWQKLHDLVVALAVRIEVGAALAAAHGEAGEGVLEDLLEAEELEGGELNLRVEAEASLIGADRGVELAAIAAVHMVLALVVDPGHTEHDRALGLGDALKDALGLVLGLGIDEGTDRLENLFCSLKELGLPRIASFEVVENLLYVGVHHALLNVDMNLKTKWDGMKPT